MKTRSIPALLTALTLISASHAALSPASAPPVVVGTWPVAGEIHVAPKTDEIRVTFSKAMQDRSWSWSTWGEENFPELAGEPRYLQDQRTCVLPVKLQPGKFYAIWVNSENFQNFKDTDGRAAVPYLLTFQTAAAKATGEAPLQEQKGNRAAPDSPPKSVKLNEDQQRVVTWTDRQFRGFLDSRSFDRLAPAERAAAETRLIDTLNGPQNREYYEAINTLGAMRSTKALPLLRKIAFDRADKNNRDRWMATRALGMIGDRGSVPELIHLVYHGNPNTRWWAQISLVRITGQNLGKDWQAWGKWWNQSSGQPPYDPTLIQWWSGQPESAQLAAALEESDMKFFGGLK